MTLKVAIVGSGPSGFYTADALQRACDDCEIDIIERLPTPYGLIRAGVAPDHQSTKNVSRNFEKIAQRPQVHYYGNVEVGRDIRIDELHACYDAVVLAVGAPLDRELAIPGADKHGVIGSAALVGWYNGHPDFRDLDPPLDRPGVAVIGNGNVALDIARVLSKSDAELAITDIASYARAAIAASAVADIHVIGRRGPVEAKFTNVELREMNDLAGCVPLVDAAQLPEEIAGDRADRDVRLAEKNLATLREYIPNVPREGAKRLHFRFYAAPVEILGDDRVAGLRLEHTEVGADGRARGTGEFFEIECGLVVPAIGYRSEAIDGAPFDAGLGHVRNDDGRAGDALYVVGWIKRGPTGVIATNRPDGKSAAQHILEDVTPAGKAGRAGLETMLSERGVRWVTFADWKRIDEAEIGAATDGAPRLKFTTVEEMLGVLGEAPAARRDTA